MKIQKNINFLFEKVSTLKGVGKKLSSYLKNKKIDKINDLIWNLPYSYTDRRNITELQSLEVGKISTIKVRVKKYNFPRIRNLPNKITCEDEKAKIDVIFFNSREGYIRKILPLNEWVIISGKINYYKNNYQITNPDYITSVGNKDYVQKLIPKYSLTEGLNEKSYRKIIDQVLDSLPNINEWHSKSFLLQMNFSSWEKSILNLHQENSIKDINSNFYRRLAYDEILSHLLVLSDNRKKIKRNDFS